MELPLLGGWKLGDKVRAGAIFRLLVKDSDRAAAIVACTMVEDSLGKRLESSLRKSTVFVQLFGPDKPLHFFGARNKLSYLLGIYGKPFYKELETIASVRNLFAHTYVDKKTGKAVSDFQSASIKRLCDRLVLLEQLETLAARRREELGVSAGRLPSWAKSSEPLQQLRNPRIRYLKTCALCVSALDGDLDANVTKAIWADNFP